MRIDHDDLVVVDSEEDSEDLDDLEVDNEE